MIKPCSYHVLVRPDEVSDRKGSLYIPASTREREQYSMALGVVVRIGRTAWKGFDDGESWAEVGDHVVYAKYGGLLIKDPADGEHYRLLLDKDIVAVITNGVDIVSDAVSV